MTDNSPGFSGVKRSETRGLTGNRKIGFLSEAREWIAMERFIVLTLTGLRFSGGQNGHVALIC
jgi:hypothetical protein